MKKNPSSRLPLFFISALHESGGGFLGRLFDGHPELKVYPFEMQLGTKATKDGFEGYCFQPRYRWPRFPEKQMSPKALHQSIIDSELKKYLSDRNTSKFSSLDFQLNQKDWVNAFKRALKQNSRKISRPAVIESYLLSFFSCWRNRRKSQNERAVLGHCPVILYDAPDIFRDFPNTKMVHLIRNPLATFHDTRLRLPQLTVDEFTRIWNMTVCTAYYLARKYPERFRRVRYEKLISQRSQTLKEICRFFGIRFSSILSRPSWNGRRLDQIPPFGGIPEPSVQYEQRAQKALPGRTQIKIHQLTDSMEKLCNF